MRFYSPKLYFRDLWISTPGAVGLTSLAAALVYLLVLVPRGETTYFLHRTVVFGVDLIGPYSQLFRPLILGLVFAVVNVVVSFLLYSEHRFLARLIMLVGVLCTLGIAVSVYTVVGLNI